MESAGGRDSVKKMLAPHANMIIDRPSGITDHTISRIMPPMLCSSIGAGIASLFLRYLTAKNTIRNATSSEKNALTRTRYEYSASTCPAMEDAAYGKRWKL